MTAPAAFPTFHVMTKPLGAICNLECVYCYYLEKEHLYPESRKAADFRMTGAVLEQYVRQFIGAQRSRDVTFEWQGGEPTLLGLAFFERAIELQEKHRGGKVVRNSLQTNGTLLDDRWAGFLKDHGFLVGISVDGPPELHDRYRLDKGGAPTHERVMRGLDALRRHGVDFNVLCAVNASNATRPLEVYRYLKTLGTPFLQFIPVVERAAAGPPGSPPDLTRPAVTPWSVPARAFGEFLCAVFDEWVRHDVGRVFVGQFDHALAAWTGSGATSCVFAETCGGALALEHNGDLFSCDHFVYPEHRLGNILELPMADLVNSERQQGFGAAKRDTLPRECRECPVRFACHGDCPKHRLVQTAEPGRPLSHLCASYKRFFTHVGPAMELMADELRRGRPAANVMGVLRRDDARRALALARPNDPCPCGSGTKFKRCHGTAGAQRA